MAISELKKKIVIDIYFKSECDINTSINKEAFTKGFELGLKKAPIPQPKMGQWIKSEIPNEEYVCSECGGACWYYDVGKGVAKSRFCPNCGAKMVEPQAERSDKE